MLGRGGGLRETRINNAVRDSATVAAFTRSTKCDTIERTSVRSPVAVAFVRYIFMGEFTGSRTSGCAGVVAPPHKSKNVP